MKDESCKITHYAVCLSRLGMIPLGEDESLSIKTIYNKDFYVLDDIDRYTFDWFVGAGKG